MRIDLSFDTDLAARGPQISHIKALCWHFQGFSSIGGHLTSAKLAEKDSCKELCNDGGQLNVGVHIRQRSQYRGCKRWKD